MRFLLPLALALAACSSDPAPADSGPADTGAPADVPQTGDLGATDTGSADVGFDRPATPDAGFDVGFEAAAQEIPGPDVVDAGGDAAGDQPADVAADARVNCAAATSVMCRTSVECAAVCLPPTQIDAMRWCCIGGGEFGECGISANANCTRP